MNVVELHPEELIDREARGALDAGAIARLEAHCARCAACRYERRMRAQFAGALEEVDRKGEVGEHVAEHEHVDEHLDQHVDEGGSGSDWRRRKGWIWGAVAASIVVGAHLMAPGVEPAPRTAHAVAFERTSVEVRAPRGRQVLAKVTPPAVPSAPTAQVLFERANRARLRGEYAQALAAYQRLQQRFPRSQEARVSYVAMGRMQLDRADAAGALASFDQYEAWGNVDVDAVVMAGRALALDELGADASSLAWAALLASHPESPYAEHARLRVAARSL